MTSSPFHQLTLRSSRIRAVASDLRVSQADRHSTTGGFNASTASGQSDFSAVTTSNLQLNNNVCSNQLPRA